MPSPQELLAADPRELRASGMSNRKGATLRALAERFLDGQLSYLFASEFEKGT